MFKFLERLLPKQGLPSLPAEAIPPPPPPPEKQLPETPVVEHD